MNNKRKGLVVALYHEDISWAYQTDADAVYVYDKGSGGNRGIPLPNIGKESHTYLTHIIRNYDVLDDVLIFTQGKPFDHMHFPDKEDTNFVNKISRDFKGYKGLSFRARESKDFIHAGWWFPDEKLPHDLVYKQIFGEDKSAPDMLKFNYGAIFCVSKDKILLKNKEFYERCLDVLGQEANPINGYVFERFWPLIFS